MIWKKLRNQCIFWSYIVKKNKDNNIKILTLKLFMLLTIYQVRWASFRVIRTLNWILLRGQVSKIKCSCGEWSCFFFNSCPSCTLLSLQFALSSPAGCTPSSDSTTRSPWTPWPRSAALCTPPLSHPVTPPIMRCSLSSRCDLPSGVLSSASSLTTNGRSSSTSTTPTEVGDSASLDSGLRAGITSRKHVAVTQNGRRTAGLVRDRFTL